MKKVQVIGGSGFIGTNLIRQLKNNYEVGNIDKAPSEKFSAETSIADIRHTEKLLQSMELSEWIVLLAAEHKDDVTPSSLYYDVNVQGASNVLAAMNKKNIR